MKEEFAVIDLTYLRKVWPKISLLQLAIRHYNATMELRRA